MFPILILSTLIVIFFSTVTTIPFAVILLAVSAVVLKKSWVFFGALGLGLVLDLFLLRPLGQTGLFFVIFIFLLFQYARKFETQTFSFVFISSFLGSLAYLVIFKYNNIFIQSFINAMIAILLFKFLWLKSGLRSETI